MSDKTTKEGWKLVPLEPTKEMMQAGFDVKGSHLYGLTYRAMIDAAPAPPDAATELDQLRARVAELEQKVKADAQLIAEQNKLVKERQEWALHTNEIIRGNNATIVAQAEQIKVAREALVKIERTSSSPWSSNYAKEALSKLSPNDSSV